MEESVDRWNLHSEGDASVQVNMGGQDESCVVVNRFLGDDVIGLIRVCWKPALVSKRTSRIKRESSSLFSIPKLPESLHVTLSLTTVFVIS